MYSPIPFSYHTNNNEICEYNRQDPTNSIYNKDQTYIDNTTCRGQRNFYRENFISISTDSIKFFYMALIVLAVLIIVVLIIKVSNLEKKIETIKLLYLISFKKGKNFS